MKSVQATKQHGTFKPLLATRNMQAAMMTLASGGKSDEEVGNEHPWSEQWVYVISGIGKATVIPKNSKKRRVLLRPGMLLLIEKGEKHQLENTGSKRLKTINFYGPPAYTSAGNLRKKP